MSKIRVLLIQNYIAHYNLPIYNLLGDHSDIDLTIAHFGKNKSSGIQNFKEQILHYRKIGPVYFIDDRIFEIADKYEVVIAMSDIHFIQLMMLGRKRKRHYKLIYWGIGVSASYKNKFDDKKKWDFLRYFFMRGADALLFYSDYPVVKYTKNGFLKEKLFVAPNTVVVDRTLPQESNKNSILFIGTLYKEKGIYELLEAYKKALVGVDRLPKLDIIGDGDEFNNIVSWIKKNNLSDNIILHGAIYNDHELEIFFNRSIATVSPNQAGLSVLKSMGFGVLFITRFDSITGGERFNIVNNESGIIYNNESELINVLRDIEINKSKYELMGKNAADFYQRSRLPEHMVKGFLDAIYYVTKK